MSSIDVRTIENIEDLEKFLLEYHIIKYPQLSERTFNLDIYGFAHISKLIHNYTDSSGFIERTIINTEVPSPVPGPNYIKVSSQGFTFTFVHDTVLDKKFNDNKYQLKIL